MNEKENEAVQQETVEQDNIQATKKSMARTVVELVSIVASSIVAIMVAFTFLFRIVGVSGGSMEDTLQEGDWLIVSAFVTEPERGDIVIITQPNTFHEPIVKRVIAVGGDEIDINFDTGEVKVNGKVIDEPYLKTPTTNDGHRWDYPLTIEEGKVFVMGDNRLKSSDSRGFEIGLIDEEYILGQVLLRFSPITEIKFFGDYDYE